MLLYGGGILCCSVNVFVFYIQCLNSREAHCAVEERCSEVSGDDCSEDEWVADDELEEVSEETDQNLLTEKVIEICKTILLVQP